MKSLVVYDSKFGNTTKVAKSIGQALLAKGKVKVLPVSQIKLMDLKAIDLLIVGSPTQGGRPTPAIQNFINNLSPHILGNARVAAFDTRFAAKEHGFGLYVLMKTIGFAAPRIASDLKSKGGLLVGLPAGFVVKDKDGPLRIGELERAASWAKSLAVVR